ncbi:MAG: hypothetical protein WBA43_23345 [Elainellaceae cyanobacterium]
MPITIPYDPGLVLGNIVDQTRIDNLKAIADAQKPIDDGQDRLNALILQRRSLDMTMQEMINMGVDGTQLTEITNAIDQLTTEMATAAVNLSKQVISAEKQIADLKSGSPQTQISEDVESPIDYNKSAIKQMPLSSDSLKLDVQYFRNESNEQDSSSHANAIATYVSYHSRSIFGYKGGAKHGAAAKDAVARQVENHNIEGTLVITANCTHKQADVFAPFVIDVDKAIHAWNALNDQDQIDMDDSSSVSGIANDKTTNQAKMSLLSGATYGSGFVGMVHIVQREDTRSSQAALSLASSLRAQMDLGGWFAKQSGELGVDSSFSNSVKNLLSTSNLSTHCSVITMGLIPSIKAATVTTVVKKLMGGPQEHMEQLAAIQGSTGSDLSTVASSASSAKEGQTLSTLSNDYMKAAVDAVGEMDKQANQVIDTNSMMTAFDDYIQKAIEGKSGVPINFFLKPISKRQIAKAWVDKYYPGEYNTRDSLGDHTDEETTP